MTIGQRELATRTTQPTVVRGQEGNQIHHKVSTGNNSSLPSLKIAPVVAYSVDADACSLSYGETLLLHLLSMTRHSRL